MMTVRILSVGRLKEKYLKMAIDEYRKRLSAYCRLELTELKDEKIEERYSDAEKEKAVRIEGQRILKALKPGSYTAALCIEGRQLPSEAFAQKLERLSVSGRSDLTFIIGGSLGLAPEVKQRADWLLSFSEMTFPHQLFRVMLLEQIYRGFKINRGEVYHK